ncbi:hypothetical protein ACOMHN_035821 [Nucella lapillus]
MALSPQQRVRRISGREVQKRLRSMKDEWWKKKAEEIQGYADSKNAKLFYSSLREVYGPPQRSTAPIRNLQGGLWDGHRVDGLAGSTGTPARLVRLVPFLSSGGTQNRVGGEGSWAADKTSSCSGGACGM